MRRLFLRLVAVGVSLCLLMGNAAASTLSEIEKIITYAQSQGSLLQSAGNLQDWYAIALGQYHSKTDFSAYLSAAEDLVKQWYAEDISRVKLTDRQRLAMAILAAGGDPSNVGGHSLLADCTYRANMEDIRRQGITSCIFGLLALDMGQYPIPAGASISREQLVDQLLSLQLADGGFALMGTAADPDITGLALQALAPYLDRQPVRQAVDRAIERLSALQLPSGGYASLGVESAESTAQVLIALCVLNIPLEDARFIQKGHTVLDGLLQFQNADGGFAHSRMDGGGSSNAMATVQALGALVALWRQEQGLPPYYNIGASATGTTTASTSAATATVKPTTLTGDSGSAPKIMVIALSAAGVAATAAIWMIVRRRRNR